MWDRLCQAFLAASKQLEDTDPKHIYKYFPNQDEWMWEQQPGFEDFRLSSWCGVLSGRDYGYDRWDSEHDWQQDRGENQGRDNRWLTRVNAHNLGVGGG